MCIRLREARGGGVCRATTQHSSERIERSATSSDLRAGTRTLTQTAPQRYAGTSLPCRGSLRSIVVAALSTDAIARGERRAREQWGTSVSSGRWITAQRTGSIEPCFPALRRRSPHSQIDETIASHDRNDAEAEARGKAGRTMGTVEDKQKLRRNHSNALSCDAGTASHRLGCQSNFRPRSCASITRPSHNLQWRCTLVDFVACWRWRDSRRCSATRDRVVENHINSVSASLDDDCICS